MSNGGRGLLARATRLSVAALVAAAMALACAPSQPPGADDPGRPVATPTSPSAPPDFPRVGTAGSSLTLDGEPWWPVGINAYQLGTDWDINAGCGAQVDLDQYFSRLPPYSLTRFNAYSRLAVDKVTGELDFRALDAVFDAAVRHRQLLIAVLTSNEGGCENDHFKNYSWFAGGWRNDLSHGLPMTFAAWLDTAVNRWKDSPALVGWTAVGEPEPSNCADHRCAWHQRECRADSETALRSFLDQSGARIREIDPDALIFSGHAGGGQCGSAGDEFVIVGASPGVDVLEYHYYEGSDDLPGDQLHGLKRRMDQARALGKPLLVAEVGMEAGECLPVASRRQILARAIADMRGYGAAGVLFWAFVPDPRVNQCTLDIGPEDPLIGMVGKAG